MHAVDINFSQTASSFQGISTPEPGQLAGYAMLILWLEGHKTKPIPLPDSLCLISEKTRQYEKGRWRVFTPRHRPGNTIASHVTFALKYEGLDLFVLKKLFLQTGPELVTELLMDTPTGQFARRIWFLYEWLLDKRLDIPDINTRSYADVVNRDQQYGVSAPMMSKRHGIRNNLPGAPEFCPLIRKTDILDKFLIGNLAQKAAKITSGASKDILRRAAAFLLLKDSKASFAIEDEYPANPRIRNWGKIIGQAGKIDLSIDEIERLQEVVFGKQPIGFMGIRKGEGFIGTHDRHTLDPVPSHISARAQDLPSLMKGLFDTNQILHDKEFNPVLAATMIAFGFVFIHPLSDGNGRIHRYLIHHLLAKMGFANRDLIFPISAAILNRISDYNDVLEAHSEPRLDAIQWRPAADHNVEILNDTADLYRYFDLTKQAEFLFECIADTIDRIIPDELDYLGRYDKLAAFINEIVALPDNSVDLLIKFIDQNDGILSKNKKQRYFDELTNEEVNNIQTRYSEVFNDT